MKVAVSAAGKDLISPIDQRFGRCPYFAIVDTEDMSFQVFENQSAVLGGGAGIQAAQFVAEKGVGAVITGNCGPNAINTLAAAGVKVFTGEAGTVKSAVDRFKSGVLTATDGPNAPEFYGVRGMDAGGRSPLTPSGSGMGMGRGRGGGRGRGMCGGKGGGGLGTGRGRGGPRE